MIYLRLPTGDHGWGMVGDNLATALERLSPVERLDTQSLPRTLDGPLLETTGLRFRPAPGTTAPRHVAYAVFEEDLNARRLAAGNRHGFDAIATACRWCENTLREAGCTSVVTIHHGIDGTRFWPDLHGGDGSRDKFVIFSGGKFEFRKAQDVVVRAFMIFAKRHDDALLVAAWNNPWQRIAHTMSRSPYYPLRVADYASCDALLRTWLATTGVDLKRVRLVPRLPNTQMADVYRQTDVGLFPNRCEGATNLVMMEYMACGRAVIATDFSGHRDILTELNSYPLRAGRSTWIFRDNQPAGCWWEPDVDELVEALESVYANRTRLCDVGRQAAKDLTSWTWERAAARFHSLLEPGTT